MVSPLLLAVAVLAEDGSAAAALSAVQETESRPHIATKGPLHAAFLIGRTPSRPQFRRGDEVPVIVVLSGCAPLADGRVSAEAEFTVFDPANQVYLGPIVRPADGGRDSAFGARLGISIRVDAPVGTYSVRARVRDAGTGRELEVRQKFEVALATDP